jgi:hemolysin activation/secretion protein
MQGALSIVAVAVAASCVAAVPYASVAQPAPDDGLVRIETATFADIAVEGSSVFAADELAVLTDPYENRPISFETLQALGQELSRRYVERGYVTSGVVLPEQAANATVVLRAVEGRLAEVVPEGNRRLRDGAIVRRVLRHVGTPVNLADVQRGLKNLQDDPLVERVNAELEPGEILGESLLRVRVTERRPFELDVLAGNDRSAAIGEDHASIGLMYHGLVGNGDSLRGRFGGSDGVRDNLLSYHVPLTSGGITLDLVASEQDADIVEEPFAAIDITSRIETIGATVRKPFFDTGNATLRGLVSFEHKRSESTLLDVPFSFGAGEVAGKARGSAVGIGVEWTRRANSGVLAVRALAEAGVDLLDATRHEAPPDSDFALLVGQVQYARRVAWRESRLLVNGTLQLAQEPLLAMYKLPVGGRYSVRGYRESQLVRDQGFVASVELQFPAAVDASGQRRGKLDFAVFADYGVSQDETELLVGPRREHLASVGIGVLWDPLPGLHLEVYRGADLADQDNPRESLQDRGIHYNASYRRRF